MPIDASFTCPNRRDGSGGCIFCDSTGSGFSAKPDLEIEEQLSAKMSELRKKGINKFMAYFQANSNTFAPVETLRELYRRALVKDVVALDISTRPDLIPEEVLELLEEFSKEVDVILELGLQSVNPNTLKVINRKHTLSHFVDAVIRAKKHKIPIVAHIIANLPWDSLEDVAEAARLLSVLGVAGVKVHSLYVVQGTELARLYERGEVELTTHEEFIERVVVFLEFLDSEIVIHRLVADPPIEGTLFGNWGFSKLQLLNMIEKKMIIEGRVQGSRTLKLRSESETSDRGSTEESPDSTGEDAG